MFRIWRSIYYKILLIVVRCSQGDQVGSAVVAVDGGAWHDYQTHVLCHEKKRGRTLMKPAPLAISSAVSAPRTGTLKLSSTPFHRESWYSSPMQPPTAAADDSKMAPVPQGARGFRWPKIAERLACFSPKTNENESEYNANNYEY